MLYCNKDILELCKYNWSMCRKYKFSYDALWAKSSSLAQWNVLIFLFILPMVKRFRKVFCKIISLADTSQQFLHLHLSASDEKIWSSKVTKILYTERDNSTCHWTPIVSNGSFFQAKKTKTYFCRMYVLSREEQRISYVQVKV